MEGGLTDQTKVILIPGTFESNNGGLPQWCSTDAEFVRSLVEHGFSDVEPFHWSTKNSHLARYRAARRLARTIDRAQGNLVLVGYSHGGSVALMASNLSEEKPKGLITVGTPFIALERVEKEEREAVRSFSFRWMMGIIGGAIYGVLTWIFGLSSWSAGLITVLLTLVVGLPLTILALNYILDRRALLFHAKTRDLTRNNDVRKFVIYIKDDEALGWLNFISASRILERTWLPLLLVLFSTYSASVIASIFGAKRAAEVLFLSLGAFSISVGLFFGVAGIILGVLSMTKYGFGEALSRTMLGGRQIKQWPEPVNQNDYRIVLVAGGVKDGEGFRHSRIMLSNGLICTVGECLKKLRAQPSMLDKFPVDQKHLSFWVVKNKSDLPEWIVKRIDGEKKSATQ
ncbi:MULTISPECIES: alpha/beta hydrolase [unclassified Bradyrhizobium]|uniref:alpha/beta hydrolase n=1 Tax=unclassified Bradyrhizobium TaxID=2631580 RepID=UPI001CD5805E|nr:MULTISPECIES: alpha/beta hydrolase [unclassified Bradyrhizobium]MCA1379030.1 alpha/beta hydrolase [Bradyrhizobium sp. IC4060]MCA1489058.1 alpha/beta hydrolase [Bradyrhizobium sp. IC4061]